ncbi:hypothetical protein DFQ01_108180 [Paenibacillus cellulosilyticus]|uniref:HTH marR-type domain-containing protein n=1 Tax=Paenibacillus cellulosilyticus TaxID=375489 RepID=A0A2V2Z2M2_9BACL|nr:MarR family transcriptional regulator [Paenibacillus cellulosilyticus]PWW02901.1 hypothetical protein DFQ01_108180 [Paenibacillus cellulosilyticus]QKS45811.1 MarR family transcriptional regulator [Paenibacillus cellulosilyticus]
MINHSDKERFIRDIIDSIGLTVRRYQTEDDEEKQWLIQNSTTDELKVVMQEMSVMMLSVLEAIGNLEPVNGITVSKEVGISKGSVSKVTRKLIDKKVIQIDYLPNNKKEVLFRTTELGRAVYQLHHALHERINSGVHRFLHRYSADELQFLGGILRESLHTSWLIPESDMEVHQPVEQDVPVHDDTNRTTPSPPSDKEDMQQIVAILNQLGSRDLKKAKAILTDVFVAEYEE